MHIRENGPKLAHFSNTVPLIQWIRLTRCQLEAPSAVEPDPLGSSCQRVDGSTMAFFMYQQAAFTSTVAAAVRLRRGVLSRPLVLDYCATPLSFPAVRARYVRFFERAVRLPEPEVMGLVDALRPGEVVGAGVAVGAGEVVGACVAVGAGDVEGVRAVCEISARRRPPLCLSPSRVLKS